MGEGEAGRREALETLLAKQYSRWQSGSRAMLIDHQTFHRLFAGFRITDSVARSAGVFYFVCTRGAADEDFDAEEENSGGGDGSPITKVVVFFRDEPEGKKWSSATFKGFNDLIAGAARHPLEQFVGVDVDGRVLSMGSGRKDLEPRIPRGRDGPQRGGIRKARMIDGYLHACSGNRGLARRDDLGQWTSLCEDLRPQNGGFEDFDAFPSGEFYAVGGRSDVWRRSPEGRWERLNFPKDFEPLTVCCAPDGWVWVGAEDDSIFKGRGHEWERIVRGEGPLPHPANTINPYRDMVWFDGRLLCSNDVAILEVDDGGARRLTAPEPVGRLAGHLSVADGTLLVADETTAAFHDGTQWRLLFDAAQLR